MGHKFVKEKNIFEKALDRIRKNIYPEDSWTKEDIDHLKTIVFALETASEMCELDLGANVDGEFCKITKETESRK